MATLTTRDVVEYYADQLIMQYKGKSRAAATVQAWAAIVLMAQTSTQRLTFARLPTSGAFTLSYAAATSASIPYNVTAAALQTTLRAMTGLAAVTVAGTVGNGFTVSFGGVTLVAQTLQVASNTLSDGAAVPVSILETDLTLPLAVRDAFTIAQTPIGVQLDALAKYAGVTRTGAGTASAITLGDADFLVLIRFAAAINNSGSDLASIQNIFATYFPNQILAFDAAEVYDPNSQDMQLTYYVLSQVASQDLIRVLVSQKVLPRPMAVRSLIFIMPRITNIFSYASYTGVTPPGTVGFADYTSYDQSWLWVSYGYAV